MPVLHALYDVSTTAVWPCGAAVTTSALASVFANTVERRQSCRTTLEILLQRRS